MTVRARRSPFFYGWIVLGAAFVGMLCAAGVRFSFGAFVKPWEAEFGWARDSISFVGSLSLLVWGLVPLLVGYLVDRYGPRPILFVAALFGGAATLIAAVATQYWQVLIAFGVFAGLAAGFGSPVGAAPLAARWFVKRRGLAVGLVIAGISASQIVFVPLVIYLVSSAGWRNALLATGGVLLVVVAPLLFLLIRSEPRSMGLEPYGAERDQALAAAVAADDQRKTKLLDAMRSRPYWFLSLGYFVCGYTTLGLIMTHFVPYAVGDLRFTEAHAAQAIAVVGIFDVAGTVTAGWISDRFGRTIPLGVTYLIRALSYVLLLSATTPELLLLWSIVFGLSDVASVPLVTQLTGDLYGRRSMGTIYASIFLMHQVGAAVGAAFGGIIFQQLGSYQLALVVAILMLAAAATVSFAIRERRGLAISPAPATG